MRGWKTLLVVGVITAGLFALTAGLRKPYAYLAAELSRRLNGVSD